MGDTKHDSGRPKTVEVRGLALTIELEVERIVKPFGGTARVGIRENRVTGKCLAAVTVFHNVLAYPDGPDRLHQLHRALLDALHSTCDYVSITFVGGRDHV